VPITGIAEIRPDNPAGPDIQYIPSFDVDSGSSGMDLKPCLHKAADKTVKHSQIRA
jgi:hypothetical protein